jgi:hypothetical protein
MQRTIDQRVAAEKQNGVETRRLKCRIDSEQSPYTCALPEHKPLRRGREMIDLFAVEEPKPKPAKIRGGVVRGSDRPVVQTHAVV